MLDASQNLTMPEAMPTTRLNLKGRFVRAGVWYLDMIREMEEEITKWTHAAQREKDKKPKSPQIQKYYDKARTLNHQVDKIVKFFNIVEDVINKQEMELYLSEKMNDLLVLQVAANKQGKEIDVLGATMAILKDGQTLNKEVA